MAATNAVDRLCGCAVLMLVVIGSVGRMKCLKVCLVCDFENLFLSVAVN